MMARLAVEYVCKQSRGLVLGNDIGGGTQKRKDGDQDDVQVQLSMQTMRTKCVSCSLLPSGTQRMSRCGTWIGLDAVTGDLCAVGNLMYLYTNTPKSRSEE